MVDSQLIADRDREIEYIRRMLVGPAFGPSETLTGTPLERYAAGILYPQDELSGAATQDQIVTEVAPDEEDQDNPISLAFERLPASMGVSFLIEGTGDLKIELWAAKYSYISGDKWRRAVLASEKSPLVLSATPEWSASNRVDHDFQIWAGTARCNVVWRRHDQSQLVTVTLANNMRSKASQHSASECLFQCGFLVTPLQGRIKAYPDPIPGLGDLEDKEFSLLYRDRPRFAVGHGCAAEWLESEGGPSIRAAPVPSHTVPAITTQLDATGGSGASTVSRSLKLTYLADESMPVRDLVSNLSSFVDQYKRWVEGCRKQKAALSPEHGAAADRVLGRLERAVLRMESGVRLLQTDNDALRSFRLANRAMLMQMLHSSRIQGTPHPLGTPAFKIDYDGADAKKLEWRPFQLGFHLLVLESLANDASPDRDLVDLIWFPTGGGKTEAYLWAAAFTLFLRRIKLGLSGVGTAVIKRYTLRLLTTQQFQRAAALICACEQVRREKSGLGSEPFRLGLWVGDEVTPNRYRTAVQRYEQMLQEEHPQNRFQFQFCPWCGTLIVPPSRHDDVSKYGVSATDTSFRFFCAEPTCVFHAELPVSVVDEDLYDNPPAMVIGTIDKFARLAWDARSGAFFGSADAEPPSLIIQDELHLISGPLGTIAGLYEAAIDTVVRLRGGRPKLIAATATIRRSPDQAQRLYAREVALFPPPGLSAADSYFAREDRSAPGRTYIGVLAAGLTPVTALVRTAAATVQAVEEAGLTTGEARDSYWTVVIYHNSRRECGHSMTLARDDIPAWIETVVAANQNVARTANNVEEVSANVSGERLPEVLAKLNRPRGHAECPDIVPCTVMMSVGWTCRDWESCSSQASRARRQSTSKPPAASVGPLCRASW